MSRARKNSAKRAFIHEELFALGSFGGITCFFPYIAWAVLHNK
ncbi:9303_t:CDS:2 [Funneliformis caledonium]|uniref:9303_t:CDS:1 n=2 Tax=Funneliformis TaxID=1117308 RepID=A0A9N8W567_9GLOM|nr:4301_t:CDS:2 [Funneliformis mosseae]CAG8472553.1 9303_t:CDS:2 [Funneliformis caledonium]